MANKRKNIFLLLIAVCVLVLVATVVFVACDKTEEPHVEHSFGEWETIVAPTCDVEGISSRVCVKCGHRELSSIEELPHTEVLDAAVAPTCTETGLSEGSHCSVCNKVLVRQETVAALGHVVAADEAVEPTCTTTGLTTGTHCSRCDEIIESQRIVNALGHHLDEANHCSICNETIEGFTFSLLEDDTYSLVSYNGSKTQLTIPSKYNGKAVTTIGQAAFRMAGRTLVSIDISDSITTISQLAFTGCSSMKSLTIGHNVMSIGDMAFMGCNAIETIKVVDGHTKYHSEGNCLIETETKKLVLGCKTSVIPDDGSVTTIGASAFNACSGLVSIEIPDTVTSIGDQAFYQCSGMTSIVISKSVTSIGVQSFFLCTGLTDIYYDGTKEEWNNIEKGALWDYLHQQYIVHCLDGGIVVAAETTGGGGGGASR